MKIKQHIAVNNPDNFLKGIHDSCFSLVSPELVERMARAHGYIDCGEVELDINVSGEIVTAQVLKNLDAEIEREQAEHALKMDMLKTRKDELLALTHEASE